MARTVDSIPDDQFDKVAQVLAEWSGMHPLPDFPVLVSLDGSEITPRQIAAAMKNRDLPTARTIRMLFSAAIAFERSEIEPEEAESLEDMLRDFWLDIESWRGLER